MGQYYTPYVENIVSGHKSTFYSHDYGNGLKLMEHSWIGNNFMGVVCNAILDKPSIVAWVGDYAEYGDIEDRNIPFLNCAGQFEEFYKKVHSKNLGVRSGESEFDYDKYRYLINNTTKEYVDFQRVKKENDADGWVVHPLSLLTAVGNGKGGGDYWDSSRDYDKVGIWAFNELYISSEVLDGYEEMVVGFKEIE